MVKCDVARILYRSTFPRPMWGLPSQERCSCYFSGVKKKCFENDQSRAPQDLHAKSRTVHFHVKLDNKNITLSSTLLQLHILWLPQPR